MERLWDVPKKRAALGEPRTWKHDNTGFGFELHLNALRSIIESSALWYEPLAVGAIDVENQGPDVAYHRVCGTCRRAAANFALSRISRSMAATERPKARL